MQVVRIFGLSAVAALCAIQPASTATPSFDCTKAESSAEMLVCGDDELATLDREIARLFTAAHRGLRAVPSRQTELVGTQRGWIRWRDSCWKEPDARACLYSTYVIRIHELRDAYADARRQDASSISTGPVSVQCPGFAPLVRITFVRLDTAMAYLTAGNAYRLVMTRAPAASGARYVARHSGGEAVFWDRGRDALLDLPGRGQLNCRVNRSG